MSKFLPVPKDLERLIEKREAEKDRRSSAQPKKNERRQKRRRKSDR
jgi:hypothetical protein